MRLVCLLLLATFSLTASAQAPSIVLPRGVAAENIDRTASPCADFDAYANGAWRATHPMPAIQTTWAIRVVTQDETRARLRSIAEEDAAKSSKMPKNSPAQMTGDFYAACTDQPQVNELGLKPLEPMLKEIDALRATPGVGAIPAISAQIIRLQGIAIAAPVNLSAAQDLHDTTRMIAEIGIGGLGLPDRDYYLRDEPRFKETREKYRAYMQQMFALAGATDEDATRAVASVMSIETALAQARLSRVELRDPRASDHPMRIADLKLLAPHFDWDAEFRTLSVPVEMRSEEIGRAHV